METFTLPYQLRSLAWYHQKKVYSIFFICVASTLKDFGLNPKNLGAELGMTMVLHTNNRKLDYHPHIYVLVPGGGIDKRRRQWKKKAGKYLFNEQALAKVFRARFLAALDVIPGATSFTCHHYRDSKPPKACLQVSLLQITNDDLGFSAVRMGTWITAVTGSNRLFI